MPDAILLAVVITIGTIGLLVLILGVVFGGVYRLGRSRSEAVRQMFAETTVRHFIPSANFFGQESLGMGQIRGNGTLVITDENLYFQLWLPKREFWIPLNSITAIEMPRSHLGKSKLRPLLKVVFQNEQDQRDSMAWLVADPYTLKKALEAIG